MPRRYCGSCRETCTPMTVTASVFPAWGNPMRMPRSLVLIALTASISLASLRSRIAFFSESDPAPRALPFSSSQGPVRKKQRGRGSQRLVESELTPAQIPRASFSPHREISPVLFVQPDQRPSASVSDLVSFGGSDDELADDSMSLVASDAEELWGSVTDPPPQVCPAQRRQSRDGCRTFPCPLQALKSWVWSGLHQRSPLAAVWMSGFCRGAVRPLNNDHRRSSWSTRRAHEILALSLLCPPPYFRFICPHYGWRRWRKGIWRMPQLDESVAAHLCPPTAIGWKAKASHPSKPCRTTSALAGCSYASAGQAASALHSMAVLQVYQAKLLSAVDESEPDPATLRELRAQQT